MRFFGTLLEILDAKMEIPEMYGWFHLTFIVLSIAAGVVLCRVNKSGDEGFVRKLLLISAGMVILLEVYKQINFSFSYDGQRITFDYQWYSFPFQFCSTPMYVSLLAGIIHKGRFHDSLCAYLATYSVFAGLCVMIYPPQVFVDTIGINIQSMVCHGAMISVGIYLLYTGHVKTEHRTILKAIPVFVFCVCIAAVMNEIAKYSGLLESETFNMFFISPHCEPSLPVYSMVQTFVPYPWCAFIYVIAFSAAAYLILLASMLLRRISHKQYKNTNEKEITGLEAAPSKERSVTQ